MKVRARRLLLALVSTFGMTSPALSAEFYDAWIIETMRHIPGNPGYWQHGVHALCTTKLTSPFDYNAYDWLQTDCDLSRNGVLIWNPAIVTTVIVGPGLYTAELWKKTGYCSNEGTWSVESKHVFHPWVEYQLNPSGEFNLICYEK